MAETSNKTTVIIAVDKSKIAEKMFECKLLFFFNEFNIGNIFRYYNLIIQYCSKICILILLKRVR